MADVGKSLPGQEGPSLQEAFAAFIKAKKQKKVAQGDVLSKPPTDPARKRFLREMFLQLVRKYIGVPYAKRHHTPAGCECEGCVEAGRQLYHDPLFLDCCGLVRKVVREMQAQLGFRLGPGNQAYQFDTLPVRVESVQQLEPGDLVFYSGEYFNPGSRRYAFDMTHVEVFVGGSTGEATIGSRERQRWVMEYDSYAFTSKRWRLIRHHFCKIDTWLEGVCAPATPHLWRQPQPQAPERAAAEAAASAAGGRAALKWDAGRYSIFAGDDGDVDEESGDEAGDD